MAQSTAGELYLWEGMLLFSADALVNRPHRHLPASLLISQPGVPFDLYVGERHQRVQAALVAPDQRQSLRASGPLTVVHIDPDLPRCAGLRAFLGQEPYRELAPDLASRLTAALGPGRVTGLPCATVYDRLDRALEASFGPVIPGADGRIRRLTRALRERAPHFPAVADMAGTLGLSESRLTHLFKQEVGVTLRRYLLHLRLQGAIHAWRPGRSFAAIAADAGFYDQPHLARTAREMLDFLPSLLADAPRLRVSHCAGETSELRRPPAPRDRAASHSRC